MSISFEPIAKHYRQPQGMTRVADVDIHEVGDLLVCGNCAPASSSAVVWEFFLTNLNGFCDYCGRELTHEKV